MTFTIDGRQHQVATNGLRAVIIDYTLSRLKKEECVSYNDLSSIDWLFEGEGDYQFEVYRLMRSETKSDWRSFHPKTNVYWLHYLADKLHSKLKRPGKEIKTLKDSILNYSSSLELFLSRTL
jgi:serine/threonine-protein kinase haspin